MGLTVRQLLFTFPLTVPDRRLKFRTYLMKHSTSRRALTSRNRTPPILLGRSLAAQTVSCADDVCSLFESTIRYIAGLISAYELSGKQHYFLIEKAKELADRLSLAWSYVSVFECPN